MELSALKGYMEWIWEFAGIKFYSNFFHATSQDNAVAIVIGSSGHSTRNVGNVSFQFLVRNNDPEQAEAVASRIHKHFNNKTDYIVGRYKVIFSRGQSSVPLYTGIDEKQRHIYSVNIDAIINK